MRMNVVAVLCVVLAVTVWLLQCAESDTGTVVVKPQPPPEGRDVAAKTAKSDTRTVSAAKKPQPATLPSRSKPVLQGARALDYLPADTAAVVVGSGIRPLLDKLGRKRLVQRYRQYYELGVAEVTQLVGHNLLQLENLPQVGIDPDGPFGIALLDVRHATVALFVTLTEPDKLKETLYRLASKLDNPLQPQAIGDALILQPKRDPEINFVLRGNQLFLVLSDHSYADSIARARAIATVHKSQALGARKDLRQVVQRLQFGRDLAGYLSLPHLLRVEGQVEEDASAQPLDARRMKVEVELKRARDSGAPPATIEMLERALEQVKEKQRWDQKWQKRRAAERQLVGTLLGPIRGAAFGIELRKQAVRGKMLLDIASGSLPHRLVRNRRGVPILLKALQEKPLYLIHTTVDIDGVVEVLRLMAATEEVTWAEAKRSFKSATQLDLDRDVLALLTGEVGLAMTGRLQTNMTSDRQLMMALGGGAVLGVRDANKAREVLDRIMKHPALGGLVQKDGDSGGVAIPVPGWKRVHIAVAGNYLAASTDRDFIRRVGAGGGLSFVTKMGNPALRELLQMSNPAAVVMVDASLLGFTLMPLTDKKKSAADKRPEVEVPHSEAYRKKQQEIDAVDQQIDAMEQLVERQTQRRILRTVELLGVTAGHAKVVPEGVAIYGGQFIDDESIDALVDHLVAAGARTWQRSTKRSQALQELYEKRIQLQEQLFKIRQEDIRKHEQEEAKRAELEKKKAEELAAASRSSSAPATGRVTPKIVAASRPTLLGKLDRQSVRKVMRATASRFRYCYEQRLGFNPKLAGKIVVQFTIAPDGLVSSAKVKQSTLGDDYVVACILRAVKRLRFPKPTGGGPVVVNYPFTFKAN